jgi:hypothetical protein
MPAHGRGQQHTATRVKDTPCEPETITKRSRPGVSPTQLLTPTHSPQPAPRRLLLATCAAKQVKARKLLADLSSDFSSALTQTQHSSLQQVQDLTERLQQVRRRERENRGQQQAGRARAQRGSRATRNDCTTSAVCSNLCFAFPAHKAQHLSRQSIATLLHICTCVYLSVCVCPPHACCHRRTSR